MESKAEAPVLADAAAAVKIDQVSKHYGEHNVQALKDVTLTVPRGKFVAIMGPSGCGKSTLLNCIGGLDVVTSGEVIIDGQNITKLDENGLTRLRRDKIGFIFQFFNLLPTLTVRENVQLPLELAGTTAKKEIKTRADQLLTDMGLIERAEFYPSQLSGGEMQRTALIRAIIHKPQIVLADEPTGNLDTDNGLRVLSLLQSLCRERGETIVMATHSEEASSYADVIVHMKDGQIVDSAVS